MTEIVAVTVPSIPNSLALYTPSLLLSPAILIVGAAISISAGKAVSLIVAELLSALSLSIAVTTASGNTSTTTPLLICVAFRVMLVDTPFIV